MCLWEASGPVSRVLSRTAIYLECASPRISSAQPERTEGQPYSVPICVCSGWGLPSRIVADALVRSYRTVSAFLPQRGGVFFSVALSVGSPRPAVSWHPALRSPDFPRAERHAAVWLTRMCYYNVPPALRQAELLVRRGFPQHPIFARSRRLTYQSTLRLRDPTNLGRCENPRLLMLNPKLVISDDEVASLGV